MGSSLRASYRFCEQLAQREAKNFFYSFLLLPPDRRRSMCALYAYMRQTDDLADEPGDPGLKAEALVDWRQQVDRAIKAVTVGRTGRACPRLRIRLTGTRFR